MSKVIVQMPAEVIPTVIAGSAVTSGQGFLLGSVGNGRVGVFEGGAAVGETGQLRVGGAAVTMVKATGQTWTAGERLYWDDTAKEVTTTSAGNTYAGWAYAAAGSGDTSGTVVLESASA